MLALPSGIQDLLEEGRYAIRYMILAELDGGAAGLWNDTYALSYDDVTYTPLAGNMTVSEIPASSNLDSDRVQIQVSNLLPSVAGFLENDDWHQRPATLFLAFLDEAQAVQHVMARFSGYLDTAETEDAAGGLAVLTFSIESNARELDRASGDTRSDASQRRRSATDGFFKHAANAASDVSIYWGRKGPQYPTKAGKR